MFVSTYFVTAHTKLLVYTTTASVSVMNIERSLHTAKDHKPSVYLITDGPGFDKPNVWSLLIGKYVLV